ncbi:MAG TPA: hypothetical protein VMB71_10000, partial [Acetobacteraceae bacterium]|nr:hypothetical protein [Acetobacteraceae bacterium]
AEIDAKATQRRKYFFFEKKNQKACVEPGGALRNQLPWAALPPILRHRQAQHNQTFFASCFSRKVTAQVGRKGGQARKDFFSEEKKQKTFISCVQQPVQIGGLGCQPQQVKVFWFFFSKKNCLPSFLFKCLSYLGSYQKRSLPSS